jgi:hypothetical protein
VARGLAAARRLLVLGQAGDREDAALADLAHAAWAGGPFDRVLVKELDGMRRGRAPGEVPAALHRALRAAGAPAARLGDAPSERGAVAAALAWARTGDLLVLPLHEERTALVAFLRALDAAGWRAGDPVPADAVDAADAAATAQAADAAAPV